MQAPVINKNRKQKVIGKKVVKKKSVRTVLSKPKTSTWPLITEDDSKELLTQLKNIFHYKHNVKVKWNDLKNVTKEQRKEKRKKIEKKIGKEERPEILKSVVFGVNAVMRGLEKHIISSVLITADVNPIEMVKHIWNLCTNLHIPVIVVPSLRQSLKESIGFPPVIVGLKRICDESPLCTIYNLTCQLSQKFTNETYPHIEEIELNDTPVKINSNNDNLTFKKSEKTDFYLYRLNSLNRAFVPPRSKDINSEGECSDWNKDFISFSNKPEANDDNIMIIDDTVDKDLTLKPLDKVIARVNKRLAHCEMETKKKRKNKKFSPVHVKRLLSNPNRKRK